MANNDHFFTFLTLGGCLSRSFSIFVDRLDIFMTVSIIVHLPAILLTVLLVLALAPSSTDDESSEEDHMNFVKSHLASILVIAYSQLILTSIVTIAGEGGIVRATADIYCGRHPEWLPSVRFGITRFWQLVGASLLFSGAVVGISCVTFILSAILSIGSNTSIAFLFILLIFIVVSIGVLACMWVFVTVIPLYPIIVIEGKGPVNALRRCMELTRGRRGYMFAGVFVLYIGQKLLGNLLHAIFSSGDLASIYFAPSGAIISFLPNVLYVPLVTILNTVLYMSVRVDKEGLTQEILLREVDEPVEYSPPVADYRQVALVDDRQQPNIVPNMSDDDFA